ncbi:MAG: helix-turn-helix domain-containing protein [Bacilli bacterium]|nr:helix-turn-helix domain-containing protein [Bacilli bacterium]
MDRETLGDIIRDLRKRKHMTQEQLAEGICSPVSISRIENGTQMPSSQVLDSLLSKLGTSTYQICNIYYKTDKQILFEKNADEVAQLIKIGQIDEADTKLEELKSQIDDNSINKQYYLLLQGSIMIYQNKISEDLILTLKNALELTKPHFCYSDFRNMLLSVREANILSLILISYFRSDKIVDAIALGEELLSSMAKTDNHLKDYTMIRINVGINLTQCLEKECRYKEALDKCRQIEEFSYKSSEHSLLPEILFIKAKQLYYLGNITESCRIVRSIFPYMEIINKKDFSTLVKKFALNDLNISL